MLRIRGLAKHVGDAPSRRTLFSGLDLDVAGGTLLAIMGESGSGKSTLLNLIAGLDTPDDGTVEIDGTVPALLDDAGRSRFRRHRLGFVFQAFHLLPHLTIEDNVALPLVITNRPARERREQVARSLEEVGLSNRARARPRELSGGEMQRAAIARALIHDPVLILADEPTGNLDAENAARVLALLRERVSQSRAACVLVTHSAAAAHCAHAVGTLSDGQLQLQSQA